MEYLNRNRLPVFTPRLDLTAEDLNAEAETLCAAINELAGRIFIIKDMIPLEERSQYAEELNYPILDEIQRIWDDIQRAWETIAQNKEECEAHYQDTLDRIQELDGRLNALIQQIREELLTDISRIDSEHDAEEERIENKFDSEMSDLERRFNALDDAAARKVDLAALLDRIQYIQDNSIPHIGDDGYWYIGKIKTNTRAQGPVGPVGPPNVLSIGEVTKGEEPAASITGDSPHQVLNLTLPKGDPGAANTVFLDYEKINSLDSDSSTQDIYDAFGGQEEFYDIVDKAGRGEYIFLLSNTPNLQPGTISYTRDCLVEPTVTYINGALTMFILPYSLGSLDISLIITVNGNNLSADKTISEKLYTSEFYLRILPEEVFSLTGTSSYQDLINAFGGESSFLEFVENVKKGDYIYFRKYAITNDQSKALPLYVTYNSSGTESINIRELIVGGNYCDIIFAYNTQEDQWYVVGNTSFKSLNQHDVLTRSNNSIYTPINDYNPATKKYVDEHGINPIVTNCNIWELASGIYSVNPGIDLYYNTNSRKITSGPYGLFLVVSQDDTGSVPFYTMGRTPVQGDGTNNYIYVGVAQNNYYGVVDKYNISDIKKIPNCVNLADAQTITGLKTFSTLPESSVTPTTDDQLVNKKYVDGKINAYNYSLESSISDLNPQIPANDPTLTSILSSMAANYFANNGSVLLVSCDGMTANSQVTDTGVYELHKSVMSGGNAFVLENVTPHLIEEADNTNGYSNLKRKDVVIVFTTPSGSSTVSSYTITRSDTTTSSYLKPGASYTNLFTPSLDSDPATKKYVEQHTMYAFETAPTQSANFTKLQSMILDYEAGLDPKAIYAGQVYTMWKANDSTYGISTATELNIGRSSTSYALSFSRKRNPGYRITCSNTTTKAISSVVAWNSGSTGIGAALTETALLYLCGFEEWSVNTTFAYGDWAWKGVTEDPYEANTVPTYGTWDPTEWTSLRRTEAIYYKMMEEFYLHLGIIKHVPELYYTFTTGDYIVFQGKLFKANTTVTTAEQFNPSHWDQKTLVEYLQEVLIGNALGGNY